MTQHKRLINTLVPLVLLLVLLLLTLLSGSDQPLFLSLNQTAQSLPTTLWEILCTLSDPLLAPLLTFVLFYKRPAFLRALIIAIAFGILCNYGFKYGFGFLRPEDVLTITDFTRIGPEMMSPSFPSGHTITIFLLMSLISHWFAKPPLAITLFVLASLIAFSRIAVGAHWPSDVLFGALLGWLIGWLAIRVNNKIGESLHTKLIPGIYFLGLLTGIYALMSKTPYPAGQWLSTAVALFAIAYSLRSITELLHRQKG